MKNAKAIMGILSLVLLLVMVWFIKKGVSPEKMQKALDTLEAGKTKPAHP